LKVLKTTKSEEIITLPSAEALEEVSTREEAEVVSAEVQTANRIILNTIIETETRVKS
jgi:hypothetical protein